MTRLRGKRVVNLKALWAVPIVLWAMGAVIFPEYGFMSLQIIGGLTVVYGIIQTLANRRGTKP